MQLYPITPHPRLTQYIDSFWVFESDSGVSGMDSRIIAPNGKPKIIIPIQNVFSIEAGGQTSVFPQYHALFIGVRDGPAVISATSEKTGSIVIELNPQAAYRLVQTPMAEFTNNTVKFGDLFGAMGSRLTEYMGNAKTVVEKVQHVQTFLIQQLEKGSRHNTLIDQIVNEIYADPQPLLIQELSEKIGYTQQYLNQLFREYIGISPKTIASIVRFQTFYKMWAQRPSPHFFKGSHMYDYYYDQPHFIKEFKRFTGYSPRKYAEISNEFGRIFFKNAQIGSLATT